MHTLFKLIVSVFLVVVGWHTPYRDLVNRYLPWFAVAPSRIESLKSQAEASIPVPAEGEMPIRQAAQPAAPQTDRSWMWNGTTLDPKPSRR